MPNVPQATAWQRPRAYLDLARPTGPLARDPEAVRTAWSLNSTRALNFDGDPSRFTYQEYRAAVSNPYVYPHARRVLHRMHPYFFAQVPLPGGSTTHTTSTGTRIETCPGSPPALMQRLEQMTAALAHNPQMRALLKRTTIHVSPPGQGLDALAGLGPAYAEAEGCAIYHDFGNIKGPAVAIRGDSVMRWDLGVAHEMIHLLEQDLGVESRVNDVWERLVHNRTTSNPDDYANPREMLAFFGQWHLAGYGHILQQRLPEVAALCQELLGTNVRVESGCSEAMARQTIDTLARWFETGIKQY